jgi:hypothetical protein
MVAAALRVGVKAQWWSSLVMISAKRSKRREIGDEDEAFDIGFGRLAQNEGKPHDGHEEQGAIAGVPKVFVGGGIVGQTFDEAEEEPAFGENEEPDKDDVGPSVLNAIDDEKPQKAKAMRKTLKMMRSVSRFRNVVSSALPR